MGMLKVNPAAEVKTSFPIFQPATYRLRIKGITDRANDPKGSKTDYKVQFEYVDGSQLVLKDGTPYNGSIEGAGNLFSYFPYDFERQGMLKGLVQAAGLDWSDQDYTQTLLGREVDAKIGMKKTTPEYPDEANEIKRFVPQGK